MNIQDFIVFLAVGALAGWLAGNIMAKQGFGAVGNIIVGIIGAVLGGFIFDFLGITTGGIVGAILMATIGAVVLLYGIRIMKRA